MSSSVLLVISFVFLVSIATENHRFNCYTESGVTQQKCEKRGCVWNATTTQPNEPKCFYPADYGYVLQNASNTAYGQRFLVERNPKYPSPYGQDIDRVHVDVIYDTAHRLRIRMTDASDPNRYEPPLQLPAIPDTKASDAVYSAVATNNSGGVFGLDISAVFASTQRVAIGTTAVQGFSFSNQFLQFMFAFNAAFNHSFGFGERYADFAIPFNYSTLAAFAADHPDHESYANAYGVHPFMLSADASTGHSFGVFIVNSNAMQVIATPWPALQYQTIGGILDIFMFFGATPSAVVQQYWRVIGNPFLPPRWSLGFHLCRWCYGSVNETRRIVQGMIAHGVPMDAQWNDIDFMDAHKDFTVDAAHFSTLPQFVEQLHDEYQMRYVHIVDPGIAKNDRYSVYVDGVADDVFIRHANGDVLYGVVWPGVTAFPDFWSTRARKWWAQQATQWRQKLEFDGWWLDMNEPSNFVDGAIGGGGCPSSSSIYDDPPFVPALFGGPNLAHRTICMSALQAYGGRDNETTPHYNVHSMYGLSHLIATAYALNATHNATQRNFILSRSTFPTAGQYGAHWTGDNNAAFEDMRVSMTELVAFNLFGLVMAGADICGFNGDTTPELCARWMALGAFYPFARNHNNCRSRAQDPVSMGEPVLSISRRYLQLRYQLMPYLYTLFVDAHLHSRTVLRSLWLNDEFAADPVAYAVLDQFMLGDALLISPQLQAGKTSVRAYLPPTVRWYDWFTGQEEAVTSEKGWHTLSTPIPAVNGSQHILPVHVKGGVIVALQALNGALNTAQQSLEPYQILVAPNASYAASGSVVVDDGISTDSIAHQAYDRIEFEMKMSVQNDTTMQFTLSNAVVHNGWNGYANNATIDEIVVYGLNRNNLTIDKHVQITPQPTHDVVMSYNDITGVLTLSQLQITINTEFLVIFNAYF